MHNNVTYDEATLVMQCLDNKDQEEVLMFNDNFIESLDVRKYVIACVENLKILKRWFSFFSEKRFKRIYGITSDGGLYFYSPYSHSGNQIHQLSHQDAALPNIFNYFKEFTVRSNLIRTYPLTFVYSNKEGQDEIGGFSGQIFMYFLRKYNAIYKETPMKNTSKFHFPEIIFAASNNKIDLTVNVIDFVEPIANYPEYVVEYSCCSGKLEKFRIVVAINGYVEPDDYFLRPFTGPVWICIGLTLIYITVFDIIWKFCTKLKIDIWMSFSQIFLNVLNVSLERPITSAYRLHAQVSLFAFIVGNIYVIYFTSYLTAYIPIKQYDSIQDLIDNNIKVMISQSKWIWLTNRVPYNEDLKNILLPADYNTIFAHLLPMKNRSIGYMLNVEEAEIFLDFHSRYKEPKFRIGPEAIFPDYLLAYLMPRHSPLKEILDNFILQIMEGGLMKKWKSEIYLQLKAAGFEKYIDRSVDASESFKTLTLEHFVFVWKLLGIGLTLASVVFVGEHIWCFYFG